MDVFTKQKRRQIMQAVRGKDSAMEVRFRKQLRNAGIRYRKNPKGAFGKPDTASKSKKVVVFLDSCFWHGCRKHCRLPKTRRDYWATKISRNKDRDKKVTKHYKELGWKVFRFWEHELKDKDFDKVGNFKKLIKEMK